MARSALEKGCGCVANVQVLEQTGQYSYMKRTPAHNVCGYEEERVTVPPSISLVGTGVIPR